MSVPLAYSEYIQRKNLSILIKTPRVPLPRSIGSLISAFPLFISGLRHGKNAQIIVCQFHPHHTVPLAAFLLGKILRRPVVIRANDIFRDMSGGSAFASKSLNLELIGIINLFNEFIAMHVDPFLVVCSENKDIFLDRVGKTDSSKKVLLSPNGFDAIDLVNLPSREAARQSLGLSGNVHMLLFVGRFSGSEYGIDILFEAFSLLLKNEPNCVLFMVGDSLPKRLELLLASLAIEKKTRIFGSLPHKRVMDFVVASDICVGPILPTMAIPLKVLEYMACEKPIVTGVGSVSQDLDPQLNFVESIPEANALSQAFLRIIHDPDYAKVLGMRAKALSSKFSWQHIANDLESLLQKQLDENKRPK